jgi:hypothetical protein
MTKINNKLAKVDESFTVNRYDNGFMLEISGRDHDDDWATSKIIVSDIEQLIDLVKEAAMLPKS